MQFESKPTIIIEDDSAARAEAHLLATERGKASGTVAALGIVTVMVLILLVGYFAWWVPVNTAQAQEPNQVIHETKVVEKPVPGSTTIINNPPVAPPIINNPTKIIERTEYVPVPVPVPDTSGTNNDAAGATSGDLGNGNTAGNSRG